MSTPLRLAAFAAGAVVVFLLAFGVGRAVGPWAPEPTPRPQHGSTPTQMPVQGETPSDGATLHDVPHTEHSDVD